MIYNNIIIHKEKEAYQIYIDLSEIAETIYFNDYILRLYHIGIPCPKFENNNIKKRMIAYIKTPNRVAGSFKVKNIILSHLDLSKSARVP